jgi:hypothetical protein
MGAQIQAIKVPDRSTPAFDRQFMGTGLMIVPITGIDINFGQILKSVDFRVYMCKHRGSHLRIDRFNQIKAPVAFERLKEMADTDTVFTVCHSPVLQEPPSGFAFFKGTFDSHV